MEQKSPEEEKLVFTQTWFEFYFVAIAFILLMLLGLWKTITSDLAVFGVFVYVLAQILIPTFLFFKYFAIRRFELFPNKIVIYIGDLNEEIIIWKSNLKTIKVVLEPLLNLRGAGRTRIRFLFYYQDPAHFRFNGLKQWLYGKSLKVNHLLFEPDTHKVIGFLKNHYSDILELDPAAEEYALQKHLDREQRLNQEDNH